jgi:hypothetical protein
LADAWHYNYTDFGEGHGRSPSFLDTFTVTFGPDGFVLEPASTFRQRFPL